MRMALALTAAMLVAGCARTVAPPPQPGIAAITPSATVTPSPTLAVPASASLLPSEGAAAHINNSITELLNIGAEDVPATYNWLAREFTWLKQQPDIVALTEYRNLITARYEEVTKAGGASVLLIQKITREVREAAALVPGVNLP